MAGNLEIHLLIHSLISSYLRNKQLKTFLNTIVVASHCNFLFTSQTSLRRNLCFVALSAHFPFCSPPSAVWALRRLRCPHGHCSLQGLLVTRLLQAFRVLLHLASRDPQDSRSLPPEGPAFLWFLYLSVRAASEESSGKLNPNWFKQ